MVYVDVRMYQHPHGNTQRARAAFVRMDGGPVLNDAVEVGVLVHDSTDDWLAQFYVLFAAKFLVARVNHDQLALTAVPYGGKQHVASIRCMMCA